MGIGPSAVVRDPPIPTWCSSRSTRAPGSSPTRARGARRDRRAPVVRGPLSGRPRRPRPDPGDRRRRGDRRRVRGRRSDARRTRGPVGRAQPVAVRARRRARRAAARPRGATGSRSSRAGSARRSWAVPAPSALRALAAAYAGLRGRAARPLRVRARVLRSATRPWKRAPRRRPSPGGRRCGRSASRATETEHYHRALWAALHGFVTLRSAGLDDPGREHRPQLHDDGRRVRRRADRAFRRRPPVELVIRVRSRPGIGTHRLPVGRHPAHLIRGAHRACGVST